MIRMQWSYEDLWMCPDDLVDAVIDQLEEMSDGD